MSAKIAKIFFPLCALPLAAFSASPSSGAADMAAKVFADYWGRIATNAAPTVSFRVEASVSTSGRDAYHVSEQGGRLAFTGANGRSLLYAVYDFFERQGCGWFWDGDRLPPKGRVDVAATDIREESKFDYRAIRYFAHRGLTRFQAEHWGPADWRREIDWCVKRRLNCLMLRIGMDDVWQKAFPEIVPYPDPAKPVHTGRAGYDNRDLFWPLDYRGELRRALTAYATARGLMVPTDFGTMTHWYSRTPQEFLDAKRPPFLPQATKDYSEPTGLVWDVFQGEWLADYWRLTEASVAAGYGDRDLLHTIGLGERLCHADRAKNLKLKTDVLDRLFGLVSEKAPKAKVLLAGWDFYSAWSPSEVRTFVPRLDPERTIVWDYEADAVEGWNPRFLEPQGNFTRWGLVGRIPYTFGIFLAYEQALDIRANYPLIEARQKLVENDPMCKGYIFWPESSHTDTFLLRYFTANAWKGGRTSAELLPAFCRARYGAQAAAFEAVWKQVIPPSALFDWFGNYGSRLVSERLKDEAADPWGRPFQDWLAAMEGCARTFAALADVRWTDDFARRDAVDLARTMLDRLVETKRRQLVWSLRAWRDGTLGETGRLTAVLDDFAFLASAMTRLLALHEDYSLSDSLDRLNAVRPVANPNFEHVLVDNAVNDYCRSHQYEAAAFWYEPLARDCAAAARAKVAANDRTPVDDAELAAKSEAYHQAMLTRPLSAMRPTAPRTEAAFRALMRELAERTDAASPPCSPAPAPGAPGNRAAGENAAGQAVAMRFPRPNVIPEPVSLAYEEASPCRLDDRATVRVACDDPAATAWVARMCRDSLKASPRVVSAPCAQTNLVHGAYELRTTSDGTFALSARDLTGIRHAFCTLRMCLMAERGVAEASAWIAPALTVSDAPAHAFRAMHVCWLPETSRASIERQIRLAAYFKFNCLVLEFWGTYDSAACPWLGWPEHKAPTAELKRLVALGRDLGVTLVPMLNVFGHASQSRRCGGKHAALDFSPRRQSLFEPREGWVWCLTNPETQKTLRTLVTELYETFGRPGYFHIGCDEADPPSCPVCAGTDWTQTVADHIRGLRDHLASLGARTLMWHDMLVSRKDPRWQGEAFARYPINGASKESCERLLRQLPKDIVICDWYYGAPRADYPTWDYFASFGFAVVPAAWQNVAGAASMGKAAKAAGTFGFMGTTWHHAYGEDLYCCYLGAAEAAWGSSDRVRGDVTDFATRWRQVGWDMGVRTEDDCGYASDEIPRHTATPR